MPDAALTQPPPLPDAPAPAPPPAPPPPAPCRPGPPPAGAPPGAAAGGVCRHGGAGPRKFSGGCLLAAAPVLRTPAKPFLEDLASAVAAASLAARRGRRACRTLRLVAGLVPPALSHRTVCPRPARPMPPGVLNVNWLPGRT